MARLCTKIALLWSLASVAPACTAQRMVAPVVPPISELPANLEEVTLAIRTFEVTNQTAADVEADGRRLLERAFVGYLAQAGTFGLISRRHDGLAGDTRILPADAVKLDVMISVAEDENRTYVFDGLFFYPFLGTLPFTPVWGTATVDARMRVTIGEEEEPPIEVQVAAPFSIILYSYYRTGPIEDAFQRAHDAVFRELSSRLVARVSSRTARRRQALAEAERLAALDPPPPPAGTSTLAALGGLGFGALYDEGMAPSTSTTTSPFASAREAGEPARSEPRATPIEARPARPLSPAPSEQLGFSTSSSNLRAGGGRELVLLEPEGFNVIDRPFVRRRPPGLLERYVGALGGVEGGMTGGVASVESRATSRGLTQTVGTGNAVSRGYRVALYKPPDRTGFFFPPIVGFLSQRIEIAGFREDVPLFVPSGSSTIPAVVTDPDTGAPVDLDEPIAYNLELESGYVGQAIGLNLVLGTEDVQLFSTLRAGINVFEVRRSYVEIFQGDVDVHTEGMSVAFFQSGSVGGQLGLAIPAIHTVIRGSVQLEMFAEFDFPDPLEFQAKVAFNQEKQVFERERVKVDAAALRTLDWHLSIGAFF